MRNPERLVTWTDTTAYAITMVCVVIFIAGTTLFIAALGVQLLADLGAFNVCGSPQ